MDGGGSPLPSTGLAAGSFLMTGSRAGSSSVTPVRAVGGLVGRASLTQKTALALGSCVQAPFPRLRNLLGIVMRERRVSAFGPARVLSARNHAA